MYIIIIIRIINALANVLGTFLILNKKSEKNCESENIDLKGVFSSYHRYHREMIINAESYWKFQGIRGAFPSIDQHPHKHVSTCPHSVAWDLNG